MELQRSLPPLVTSQQGWTHKHSTNIRTTIHIYKSKYLSLTNTSLWKRVLFVRAGDHLHSFSEERWKERISDEVLILSSGGPWAAVQLSIDISWLADNTQKTLAS